MKRLHLRRKALFRALRLAALAFLCLVGAQRAAQAQVSFTTPFSGSGTTYGATSTTSFYGAFGFSATGSGYNLTLGSGVSVKNNSASGYTGTGAAHTPYATVTLGGGTVTNSGYIGLTPGSPTNGAFYAALVLGAAGDATVTNHGTISAYAQGSGAQSASPSFYTSGIYFYSASGSSLTVNNESGGNIFAGQYNDESGTSYSLYAVTSTGTITINNQTGGTISHYGNNSSIGYGIYATSGASTGTAISITNQGTGTITGSGTYAGTGIYAATSSGGAISITNEDTASISGTGAVAGSSSSSNSYGIYATSAASTGTAISITNEGTGSITASGVYGGAGIYASAPSGGAISITNENTASISGSGSDIDGFGNLSSYGIQATSSSGAITINNLNTASISANNVNDSSTTSSSYGIKASSSSGAITINNLNAATVSASSYTAAYGIYAATSGTATVTNAGTVTASGAGSVNSYGIYASGVVSVTNSGSISAVNYGGSNAYGISSSGSGSAYVLNSGTISASAYRVNDYGIYSSSSGSTYVKNTGTITASVADGATATYGIYLVNPGTVYNTGAITAANAAIFVPSGSTVTLAGASNISGLIKGGANAASTSTLNFSLAIPTGGITAAKSLLDAAIATYHSALTALGVGASSQDLDGTVTLNGVTYNFEDFGTIVDDIGVVSGGGSGNSGSGASTTHYAPTPGFTSMGTTLDNLSSSTNPNAVSLLTTLNKVPTANLPAALAQLAPSKTTQQMVSSPVSQATFQNIELGHRLAMVRQGLAGGTDWSGLQFASADDPMLSQLKGQLYAYNPVSTPGNVSDTVASLSSGEQMSRWGTFVTGSAVLANQNATATQNKVDSTTIDLSAGVDYHLDSHWAVGFLFGYGRSTAAVDEFGSRLDNDQYRFGPYAGYSDGPWFANASAEFAFNKESSDRAIPLLGEVANAHPEGTQYGGEMDGGYEFKALDNKLIYGPTASLQYTHLDFDPYTESGSVADLSLSSQSSDSLQMGLGGKASYDVKWNWNGATIRPDIHGSWLHEFMANNNSVTAAFAVPGAQSFTSTFQRQQRDSGLVGCGVQNIFRNGSLLFLNYDAQVGIDNYLAESISGGLKIVF